MNLSFWQEAVREAPSLPTSHSLESMTKVLLELLRSSDPVERDEIAFTLLATWIDAGHYNANELSAIQSRLEARLNADSVFERSFAVLVLGYLVEYDHKQPYLEPHQLTHLLETIVAYLHRETDERGYVPDFGWAHALTHTADCLAEFAKHTRLETTEKTKILSAISQRLSISSSLLAEHEPSRLAKAAALCLANGADFDRWASHLGTSLKQLRTGAVYPAAYINLEVFLASLSLHLDSPKQARVHKMLFDSGFALEL